MKNIQAISQSEITKSKNEIISCLTERKKRRQHENIKTNNLPVMECFNEEALELLED